jgi:hypothetical protein
MQYASRLKLASALNNQRSNQNMTTTNTPSNSNTTSNSFTETASLAMDIARSRSNPEAGVEAAQKLVALGVTPEEAQASWDRTEAILREAFPPEPDQNYAWDVIKHWSGEYPLVDVYETVQEAWQALEKAAQTVSKKEAN